MRSICGGVDREKSRTLHAGSSRAGDDLRETEPARRRLIAFCAQVFHIGNIIVREGATVFCALPFACEQRHFEMQQNGLVVGLDGARIAEVIAPEKEAAAMGLDHQAEKPDQTFGDGLVCRRIAPPAGRPLFCNINQSALLLSGFRAMSYVRRRPSSGRARSSEYPAACKPQSGPANKT